MNTTVRKRIEQINRGEVPQGYKRTRAGLMPYEWIAESLHRARDVFKSVTVKGNGGKLEVLSATQDKGIIPRNQVDIDIKFNEKNLNGYKKVEVGNFVISLRSFQGGIEYSRYEGLVSPAYTVLSSIIAIDEGYYKQYFKTTDYINRLNKGTYGIRDGKQVGFEDFGNMIIHYPPFAEQQKIAEILQTQDRAIELQEQLIEQYKQLKKGLLDKMFPKKGSCYPEIRFPGFTAPWEQRKLGDIGKTYGGLSGKSKEDFGHGDARFVTYMNVFSNPVGDPAMTEAIELDGRQNEVKKGDIFFTTSSETPEEVGMSCVWMENMPNTYLNSFCFGYRPIVELDLYYLAYVLRSSTVRHKFIFLAQGISRYNISKNKAMEMLIPVPNMEEQVLLGAFFKNLDNLITLHQRKLEEMKNYKKALMQLLLTGIVRV